MALVCRSSMIFQHTYNVGLKLARGDVHLMSSVPMRARHILPEQVTVTTACQMTVADHLKGTGMPMMSGKHRQAACYCTSLSLRSHQCVAAIHMGALHYSSN